MLNLMFSSAILNPVVVLRKTIRNIKGGFVYGTEEKGKEGRKEEPGESCARPRLVDFQPTMKIVCRRTCPEAPAFVFGAYMPVKEIAVSLSLGKDSLAVLSICKKQFERVEAFTLLWAFDLEYQQRYIRFAEEKFAIKILQLPIMDLAEFFGGQYFTWYRPSMPDLKKLTKNDIWDHVRRHFNVEWIATGERITDNFERGSRLRARGMWDQKFKLYQPIMDWTDAQVFHYLKLRHIPLPPRYTGKTTGYKAEMVSGEFFFCLKLNFPEDYERLLAIMPFAEAIRKRFELYDKRADQIRSAFHAAHGLEGVTLPSTPAVGTSQEQTEGKSEKGGPAPAAGI